LCATSDPSFAQTLVDVGGRQVHLEGGRIAGAPAIGLVPTPVQFPDMDMGTLKGVRGEQSSPTPYATSDGVREPEKADSAEVIQPADRRSSGEESS
jgi:hypothetical protein